VPVLDLTCCVFVTCAPLSYRFHHKLSKRHVRDHGCLKGLGENTFKCRELEIYLIVFVVDDQQRKTL